MKTVQMTIPRLRRFLLCFGVEANEEQVKKALEASSLRKARVTLSDTEQRELFAAMTEGRLSPEQVRERLALSQRAFKGWVLQMAGVS